MDSITEEVKRFASFLFDIFKEAIGHLPVIINFCLWIFAGLLILPCVFIANAYFGAWEKWGYDF